MPRPATARELVRILRADALKVRQAVLAEPVLLSVPTDGRGARIRVATPENQWAIVPPILTLVLEGEELSARTELAHFEQPRPQRF